MKKITGGLTLYLVVGLIVAVIIGKYDNMTNGILFFIAYESLLYPVFKGFEDNHNAKKIRKIIYVGSSNNPELIECKINKKLDELSKDKFTVIDIQIIQSNGKRRNTKEAYILYY